MKRIVIAFCTVSVLFACNGNQRQKESNAEPDMAATAIDSAGQYAFEIDETVDIPMPKAADELFDDFFYNFAASKKLQLERILFPLTLVEDGKTAKIDRKAWKMEYFFMRQGYYTLLFDNERQMDIVKDTAVSHAVVEKIFFDTQTIRQYVFDRIRGTWMLTSLHLVPISDSSNATFLEFFHRFATDKEFQAESLGTSVKFMGPDPDDDFAMMEGEITADTWEAFAPELPKKMIYNIVYGHPRKEGNSMIFLLRGIANGQELQMTFRRADGNWRLTKLST